MIKTSDVPAFITVSLKSAAQLCCDSNVCLLSVLIVATGSVHTPRKTDLKPLEWTCNSTCNTHSGWECWAWLRVEWHDGENEAMETGKGISMEKGTDEQKHWDLLLSLLGAGLGNEPKSRVSRWKVLMHSSCHPRAVGYVAIKLPHTHQQTLLGTTWHEGSTPANYHSTLDHLGTTAGTAVAIQGRADRLGYGKGSIYRSRAHSRQ